MLEKFFPGEYPSIMKGRTLLWMIWIALLSASFGQTTSKQRSPRPPKGKSLTFTTFQLNQATVEEAIERWKQAAKAADPKGYGVYSQRKSISYHFDDARLTLSLKNVTAYDALEKIIEEFNAQTTKAMLAAEWNDSYVDIDDRVLPPGEAKARSIQLPEIRLRDTEFLEAVEAWSKMVKREDPERDGVSYRVSHLRDKFAFAQRYDFTVAPTDAAGAIGEICRIAHASLRWGVTERVGANRMREYDLEIIQAELRPELRKFHPWKSADGSKTIQGRFLGLNEGKVKMLLKSTNRAVEISLENLSAESQQLARDLAK